LNKGILSAYLISVQIAKYLTADNSVFPDSIANDMCVTQDLNSFGEIIDVKNEN
jgi:hypothetical protein